MAVSDSLFLVYCGGGGGAAACRMARGRNVRRVIQGIYDSKTVEPNLSNIWLGYKAVVGLPHIHFEYRRRPNRIIFAFAPGPDAPSQVPQMLPSHKRIGARRRRGHMSHGTHARERFEVDTGNLLLQDYRAKLQQNIIGL
jgi:hypothetical protein